jgi:hypothetical protein
MASYSTLPPPGLPAETKSHPLLEIHENQSAHCDGVAPSEQRKHRPLRQRLGTWSIGVLILSTIATVAIVGFLAALWQYGNNPSKGSHAAHAIAVDGYMVKAITLSSVVLRLAVALQAGICTSLAAALLLESNKVPLPDLLHFGAIRIINSGPPALMYPIGRQLRVYMRTLPAVIMVVIFLTTTASQLGSTILVLDLLSTDIEGSLNDFSHSFGNDNDTSAMTRARLLNIDFWGSRPLAYIPFGEIWTAGHSSEHMHDTGTSYDGMVPSWDAEVTSRLRAWNTVTTVFASRVACVAPTIDATFQQDEAGGGAYITGNATFESGSNDPVFCVDGGEGTCVITFNCSLPTYQTADVTDTELPPNSDWIMGICAVGVSPYWTYGPSFFGIETATVDVITNTTGNATGNCIGDATGDPSGNSTDDATGACTDPSSNASAQKNSELPLLQMGITMVLNHTGLGAVNPALNATKSSVTKAKSMTKEWATYSLTDRGVVDLSLCFVRAESRHKYVKMRSHKRLQTAEVGWDFDNWRYDTDQVQRLYDVNGDLGDAQSRMVLEMEMPIYDEAKIPSARITDAWRNLETGLYSTMAYQGRGTFLPGCFGCGAENAISVHPHTSTLFQDIVKRTRHPASGLQTIFSTIAQSAYYEDLPTFNVDYPTQNILSLNMEIPQRWIGFGAVVGILTLHLAMVIIMLYLFATRTKYSMVGEMWHSIGHVIDHVPERLLKESMGRTDDEIRTACKQTGMDRSTVGLYRDSETSSVEMRERR